MSTPENLDDVSTVAAGPWDHEDRLSLLASHPMDQLLAALENTPREAVLCGVGDGLRSIIVAQVAVALGRSLVVVAPTPRAVHRTISDLALYVDADRIVEFPSDATSPYGDVSVDRQVDLARACALYRVSTGDPGQIIVLTAAELARRTVPTDTILDNAETILVDDSVDNAKLRALLAACGYTSVTLVEDPGTFAIRGDIIDLWPPTDDRPLRIERWGDEVTAIKRFDPRTQRTGAPVSEARIFPIREVIFTERSVATARRRLRVLAESCGVPSKQVRQRLDDLDAGIHFLGIEGLLPAFHESLSSLTDLFANDAITVVIDPDSCKAEWDRLWTTRIAEHTRRRDSEQGFLFEPAEFVDPPRDLEAWLAARPATLTFLPAALDLVEDDRVERFDFKARSNADVMRISKEHKGASGGIKALIPLLERWRATYGRVVFACDTAGEAQRLADMLETYEQPVDHLLEAVGVDRRYSPPTDTVEVAQCAYSSGFRSPALGLAVITGQEVFGTRIRRRARTQTFQESSAIASFRDLEVGDLVVHVDFGIGRYLGLHRMDVGGVPGDFLLIDYAGTDRLYLPVYRLGRVQKYIGGESAHRLDKLGGTAWESAKEKVRAHLRKLAIDLVALYARRQAQEGFAFPAPDDYFREFEAAFPYEETRDQENAIADVLHDLKSHRIADRLICGDVGFGKTEVAIRAAFLCALAGRQVAVLVPTTVLSEQHLATFRARLADYPVRVEVVSRFRSKQESTQTLKDLEAGKVDILIGTHRILSKDIVFRDLGLLIVDEEQRFGVGHKEKLKTLKTKVDCLTMSATPIPRTLHMSLAGIRDMSIIATPPPGRLAVRTHIARFSDNVIREAILREIQRGGQVFFVHNRVETIEQMRQTLGDLVPEARIAVGHGQMKEGELEKVMLGFVTGEFNVLLSTTIVESGIDIPNANTMLIDRADTFGLSQLYQLRGRIGRSKVRAYCYLLVRGHQLTDIASRRLDVIERFSELGSGFHVASYDLEMRGAGNLLGAEQHGNLATVGLDLYSELLDEAITEARGEEVETEVDPEVNVRVPAYIPEGYIQEVSLRLLFYKRLSLARDEEELEELMTEIVDRFGALPAELTALRQVVAVKLALKKLRLVRLDVGPGVVQVELGSNPAVKPGQIITLIQVYRGRYVLTPDMKLIRKLKPSEADDDLRAARLVCREIMDAAGL